MTDYSNTATLLETEGGALTRDLTATSWMVWSEIGSHDHILPRQGDLFRKAFTVTADGTAAASFMLDGPGDFMSPRLAALSIQDTSRVPNNTGWLFRSLPSSTTLPTEPIELIAAKVLIAQAEFDTMLPSGPLTADAMTTITSVSAVIRQGALDLTANGSTTHSGSVVGFTYTGQLDLTPSSDFHDPLLHAFRLVMTNEAVSFAQSGPDAAIVLKAVANGIATYALPNIQAKLQDTVGAGVVRSFGRELSGSLPTGVVLSVRSVQNRAGEIEARAAVGAFGGVVSKLPAVPKPNLSPTNRICPATTLQMLGYTVVGLEILRDARDGLLTTSAGRHLVAVYYEVGPEIAALLVARPRLAGRVAVTASAVAAAYTEGQPLGTALRWRCERLVQEIAAIGSPDVRMAAEEAIAALHVGVV